MFAPHLLTQIVIRYAEPGDAGALERLAGRDSQRLPRGELLVAEADGEVRAAVPLDGRTPIADPFHRTGELVRLLELRRLQLEARAPRPARPRRRRPRASLVPAFVGRLARR